MTLLITMAIHYKRAAEEALITAGADADIKDNFGKNAIMYSLDKDCHKVTQIKKRNF